MYTYHVVVFMNQGSGYSSTESLVFRYGQDTDWSCILIKTQPGRDLFPPNSFTWLLVVSSSSRIIALRGSVSHWLLVRGSPQFFAT